MMSANDVKWCHVPGSENLLATASSTSAIVIWDVEAERKTERRKALQAHNRAANSVCWHNVPHCLISASQDGCIHYWDVRAPDAPQITFQPRSDAVREVDFNPFYGSYFAAAFDDGTVQAWDIRKPNACERRLTAHDGLVLSVAWHPQDSSILASGGRDGTVKVWDLNVANRPSYQIQTIAAVGKVSWRPKCTYQICSSAAVIDFSLQIWDLHRQTVPYARIPGHADVVTGLVWPNGSPHAVITASKDGHVGYHKLRSAEFPSQKMRSNPICWNPSPKRGGEVAYVCQRLDRSNPEESTAHSADSTAFASGVLAPSPFVRANEKCHVTALSGPNMPGASSFEHMAAHYKLSGATLREVCEWNARVAKEAARSDLSPVWMIVLAMLDGADEDDVDVDRPKGVYGSSANLHSLVSPPTLTVTASSEDRPSAVSNSSVRRNLSSAMYASASPNSSDDESQQPQQQQQQQTSIQALGSMTSSALVSGSDAGLFSDSDDDKPMKEADNSDSDDPFRENSPVSQPLDLNALREATSGPGKLSSPAKSSIPSNTVQTPVSIVTQLPFIETPGSEMLGLESDLALETPSKPVPWRSAETVIRSAEAEWGKTSGWDPLASLEPVFTALIDQGDVQTCFHLAMAIGIDRLGRSEWCPDKRIKRWCVHYLDLLSQMRLWSIRNHIIRNSPWEDVSDLNKKGTVFFCGCPYCLKPLSPNSWSCTNCKKIVAWCSLCRQPARGLVTFCQTCGHSAHSSCMQAHVKLGRRNCPEPSCTHMCFSQQQQQQPK